MPSEGSGEEGSSVQGPVAVAGSPAGTATSRAGSGAPVHAIVSPSNGTVGRSMFMVPPDVRRRSASQRFPVGPRVVSVAAAAGTVVPLRASRPEARVGL